MPGLIQRLSKLDRTLMCWWILTGLTHLVLEGYYLFTPNFYQRTSPIYIAELWKEYSEGDSRYASRDSIIISLEVIATLVEGPVCLFCLYAIAAKESYTHVLQLAISLAQLYGATVYYLMAYLDGDNFATNLVYYSGYYVFANSFWVVIPTAILIHCWKKICAAIWEQD